MTKLPSVAQSLTVLYLSLDFALLFCFQPSASLFSASHPTISICAPQMPYPCVFLCLPASLSEAAFLLLSVSLSPLLPPDLQFTCHSQDGVA